MSEAKHNEENGVPRARATVPFTHETAEHIRLIAAAPELLAALEAIVGEVDGWQIARATGNLETEHTYASKVVVARTAARAAIAKAKGEAE